MNTNFFEKEENTKINEDSHIELINQNHTEELFLLVDKNREYLREWLPWLDFNKQVSDTKKFVQDSIENFQGNKSFQSVIIYKNQIVGCIGLHDIDWEEESSKIGYWIAKDFQGKGLTSKATQIVLNYSFNELKLKNIQIRCAVENKKSRAIPEKLGFSFLEIKEQSEWLYDHFVDHAIYEMKAN